ncbi:hypothetical protein WMY93_008768 [Mugilogobius chulae]|uniref:Uncharacterized protein n=1 Tax=Mugilogobius chulae TaxID=88201 RepID=A0AAW0P9H6_9GOBI
MTKGATSGSSGCGMKKRVLTLLVLWMLVSMYHTDNATTGVPGGDHQSPRIYEREFLLTLQNRAAPEPGFLDDVPRELLRQPHGQRERRLRRRGRRGGIRQRLRRRRNKPPLPSILFSNARSLRNKVDELRINTRLCHEYRESCLLVYTETWLQEDDPDQLAQVQGFVLVRQDRKISSGKSRGGGICVFINERWCRNQYHGAQWMFLGHGLGRLLPE